MGHISVSTSFRPIGLKSSNVCFRARLESFGFQAIVVDGHSVDELSQAFTLAENTKGKPTCVLAKTFKGNDFPGIADEMNWHGKALGAKTEEVVAHLKTLLKTVDGIKPTIPGAVKDAPVVDITGIKLSEAPAYKKGRIFITFLFPPVGPL